VRLRLEDAGIPWLRHDWNNSGEVLDPKGRATWGLHRGDAEILHLREVWR